MVIVSVTFETFPDGTPITSDTILTQNAFSEKNIMVYGAPTPNWCKNATKAAVRMPNNSIPSNYLTTSTSDDVAHCNSVPIAIKFRQTVRNVTLIFRGATQIYTLNVYDNANKLIGSNKTYTVANAGDYKVTFNSKTSNIKLAIFGCAPAFGTTAITEIHFSK